MAEPNAHLGAFPRSPPWRELLDWDARENGPKHAQHTLAPSAAPPLLGGCRVPVLVPTLAPSAAPPPPLVGRLSCACFGAGRFLAVPVGGRSSRVWRPSGPLIRRKNRHKRASQIHKDTGFPGKGGEEEIQENTGFPVFCVDLAVSPWVPSSYPILRAITVNCTPYDQALC